MLELDEIDELASKLESKEFVHSLIDSANQKAGLTIRLPFLFGYLNTKNVE